MTNPMRPRNTLLTLDSLARTAFWVCISGTIVLGCTGVDPGTTCTSAGGSTGSGLCATGGASSVGGAKTVGGSSATGGSKSVGGSSSAGGTRNTGGSRNTGGAAPATGGATSGTGGTTSGHTNPLSQALIDEFVTAHNNARSGPLTPTPSPALPPVTWDYTLADVAYNYLSQCPGGTTSLAPHNANRTTDYAALGGTVYVGENIYASSGSSATPTAAVALWMTEAANYNYATNTGSAGHYTQVVWRTSVRIGCAIVNCPNYQYPNTILCDYAPGGNISGQKPY
jgi:pathogenesis-related protein 1